MDDFEVLDMSVSSDKSRGDRMWNGYRLERTLGRGEFATVKLAVDTIAQAKQAAPALVAIKFIKIVGKERSRVSREALVLASLQDGVAPNIVPIKAIMGTNEGVAIVMKYCRAGELFDLVERKRGLSEVEGRFFFRQLLTAVDYLHATLGIVHRDIKLVCNGNLTLARKTCCLTVRTCTLRTLASQGTWRTASQIAGRVGSS